MNLKKSIAVLALVPLIALLPACSGQTDRETLTQISTIDALLNGVYDGVMTIGELKEYGDFGIGTFEALDGEMLVLDGVVYQVRADGAAYVMDNEDETPFASVTYFDSDYSAELPEGMNYAELQEYLDSLLPTENIFYAFKISGSFSYMKTRSVPAQEKPYPPLVEVTQNQPEFEFGSVEGTIVGFRCPSFVDGVNVPGYHLHFLTADKDAGGHILDFNITQAEVSIDYTSEFRMILPGEDSDFYKLNLEADLSEDLEQVEK
jgi:acetolactate decarboxylase